MLSQLLEDRLARVGVQFKWGYTKGLVARRMLLEGVDAQSVARETRRQPDYIDRVRRDASDDLLRLAELEAESEPVAIVLEVTDREAEDFVPFSDTDHAILLYQVRQSQRTGNPTAGPQPLEGDRDTVNARVETLELCLEAVRAVRKVDNRLAVSP